MENAKKNLRISTCSLKQWAMDFEGNQKNIIECLTEVKENHNPDIVLLPELATTGYSCQDHFREKENYFLAMNIIKKIIESELTMNMLVVIGNPIIFNNKKYNTMTYILNKKIILIRPKITLADDGNYREARFFSSWEHGLFETFPIDLSPFGIEQNVRIGNKIIELNGIKIGTEICEELWTSNENNRVNAFNGSTKIKVHDELYKNGVNVVLNSSGSHFEMGKLETRIDLIKKATEKIQNTIKYMYIQI
jgi:NAD+ synthase (glutamine-hydrolysing)